VSNATAIQAHWCTPVGASAIAVLQLHAKNTLALSAAIQGALPAIGAIALRDFPGLDDALLLRVDDNTLLITPHGGPRLRQLWTQRMLQCGAQFAGDGEDCNLWNATTNDAITRHMLAALPTAASIDAIDLLLVQPQRWQLYGAPTSADTQRSQRLRRLIHPPTVAIIGAPNAGKSSLLNALAGREVAAASPIAGTTRDFVSARISIHGLVCLVIDAPGTRETRDVIEAQAIAAARDTIMRADLCLCLAAPNQYFLDAWPDAWRVRTKSDLAGPDPAGTQHRVSAITGEGVNALTKALRETLVPAADLASDRPFHFL